MAWRGMMAHFKDVGLGRGQARVPLLEREDGGQRERLKEKKIQRERESTQTAATTHSRVGRRPPKRPEKVALMKADYVWACMCEYDTVPGTRTNTLYSLISVRKCGDEMN